MRRMLIATVATVAVFALQPHFPKLSYCLLAALIVSIGFEAYKIASQFEREQLEGLGICNAQRCRKKARRIVNLSRLNKYRYGKRSV